MWRAVANLGKKQKGRECKKEKHIAAKKIVGLQKTSANVLKVAEFLPTDPGFCGI